ncbi:hypothetical protein RND81_02G230000 [Saponaria officinalis]|uniref:Uncharacterized protein n=1 Tax=Saponaria officinalis TaxID=3572 RepID=A0AAW1MX81_SAPOF
MSNIIIKNTLESWLEREYNGVTIYPQVRNQNLLSGTSCVHHSFCHTIGTLHKMKYPDNDDSIDIRWLIRIFPPPTTAQKLIEALKNSSKGNLKASNSESFPFKVIGSTNYNILPSCADKEKKYRHNTIPPEK